MTVLFTFAVVVLPGMLVGGEWPQFRGPQGTGIASAPDLPTEWTSEDYAWETLLPGIGHSSPVLSGTRLFVTTANEDGTARRLVCLDAGNGEILWTRSLELQPDTLHAKNSHASGTPAVSEAEGVVVVPFADDNRYVVAAFRLDGSPAWSKDLGGFESQHGHGASPIIWQGMVIVPNDQDGPSSLVALDARTGETVWDVPRESGNTAYGTPLVLDVEGRAPQLIVASQAMGVTSVDPSTGRMNWQSGPLPQRTVASPVYAGGLIYQTCGQAGRGVLMVGVDPFASSDAERVVFEESRQIPYVPTPIAYEGHLYLWNDNGVVVCLDAETRKPIWTERAASGTFSGSPVCVNGLLYAVNEDGEVFVVRASPQFEVVGRASLGDRSHATPAVADGKMYFRTFHKVICLPAKGAE